MKRLADLRRKSTAMVIHFNGRTLNESPGTGCCWLQREGDI